MPEKRDPKIVMNSNRLVQYLGKLPHKFTKADIVKYIEENEISRVNFRYVGGDGRLKTLNFVITSKAYLNRLLSAGERVDGSSLFPYMQASSSDLYVIPRFRTAFLNPFSPQPAVDLLCSYYDPSGQPSPMSPENVLRKAAQALQNSTGITLYAMGELEYYVISPKSALYPMKSQKGYKESQPFSKMESLRIDAMEALAQVGVAVKYGHNEVGSITDEDRYVEQNEIELLPVPLEDAADHIALGRWVLRMVGHKYGVTVTFAPKIVVGHAGSGLHIHTALMKDGKNITFRDGKISREAKKAIAGILSLSPALTAFGNVVPTSYLRLVPHQEAPTSVFWGERNRLALVRVPLGWQNVDNMVSDANPLEKGSRFDASDGATFEFRTPDGSADIYYLLAGIAVAVRLGLGGKDSEKLADRLYIAPGAKPPEDDNPGGLRIPTSCSASAEALVKNRHEFERDGIFPPSLIDGMARRLRSYDDRGIDLHAKTAAEIKRIMDEHLHCA